MSPQEETPTTSFLNNNKAFVADDSNFTDWQPGKTTDFSSSGPAQLSADETHVSLVKASHIASPVPSGLNEVAFRAALARRPLLAAQLAMIHRVSHAARAMRSAEACSTATALPAASQAAAVLGHNHEHAQPAHSMAALEEAEYADTSAESTFAESPINSNRSIGESGTSRVVEEQIKEVEIDNSHSTAARIGWHAPQGNFSVESRQNLTRLLIEVALEVKLLAWREAEQCPTQLQALRAMLPLCAISPLPFPTSEAKIKAITMFQKTSLGPLGMTAKEFVKRDPLPRQRSFGARVNRLQTDSSNRNIIHMAHYQAEFAIAEEGDDNDDGAMPDAYDYNTSPEATWSCMALDQAQTTGAESSLDTAQNREYTPGGYKSRRPQPPPQQQAQKPTPLTNPMKDSEIGTQRFVRSAERYAHDGVL